MLINEAVPATDKSPVITALPVTVKVVPSNVKLVSPFIVPAPVAVNTLLSALLVIAFVKLLTEAAYDELKANEALVELEA